jgi:hypothetical protein
MGFWDTITDLVEAATPWATADAEAPAQETVCVTFVTPAFSASHRPLKLASCYRLPWRLMSIPS